MLTIVRLKHWQIFAILFCVALLKRIILISVVEGNLSELLSDILSTILYVTIIGWLLLTGIALNKKQESGRKLSFTVPIIIALLSVLIFVALRFSMTIDQTFNIMADNHVILYGTIVFLILSMGIISGYTAKSLKLKETTSEVDINDYFGDTFFLFLFLPIAIWFIQPRVNRQFEH